ncbi:hypothetical protein HYQ44_008190 [Verticillium longisporum]|nr:hypothetical protein HYQ44_008190 [Verticillium longisporum]
MLKHLENLQVKKTEGRDKGGAGGGQPKCYEQRGTDRAIGVCKRVWPIQEKDALGRRKARDQAGLSRGQKRSLTPVIPPSNTT